MSMYKLTAMLILGKPHFNKKIKFINIGNRINRLSGFSDMLHSQKYRIAIFLLLQKIHNQNVDVRRRQLSRVRFFHNGTGLYDSSFFQAVVSELPAASVHVS